MKVRRVLISPRGPENEGEQVPSLDSWCVQDVDDIHEYLLLKGVDAVSIHGGKEQDERNEAIKLFKVGQCGSSAHTSCGGFFPCEDRAAGSCNSPWQSL